MLTTTGVHLTDEELALLDGRVRPEIQKEVALALGRLQTAKRLAGVPEKYVDLVTRVVEEAEKNGLLVVQSASLRRCGVCGESAGYATYKRNSANHRKGDRDYNKPLVLWGVELAHRSVTVQNHVSVGCCSACFAEAKPHIVAALVGLEAELPQELRGEGQPKYKRYDNKHCTKCGWTGHEGQLGQLPAVMGGKYPGKCPSCGVENRWMGPRHIETVKGFTLVEVYDVYFLGT